MHLLTPRLRGERVEPRHFDELRRMHTDAVVMTYLGGVQSEADTEAYLTRNLAHWAVHDHGLWIVYERDGVEPIGRAVLRHLTVDGVDEVETGYAFYEPYWRRGYATEVTQECLRLGFEALGLPSIVAVTMPDNEPSQRVLTRSGFAFERRFMRDLDPLALYRIYNTTTA